MRRRKAFFIMQEGEEIERRGAALWHGPTDAATPERYLLRLYVTGTTPNSVRAIANLKRICEEHLLDSYDLEVIDLYQQPHLASSHAIIAVPTLVKHRPEPLRRIIGDLSDTARVMRGLNLNHKKS